MMITVFKNFNTNGNCKRCGSSINYFIDVFLWIKPVIPEKCSSCLIQGIKKSLRHTYDVERECIMCGQRRNPVVCLDCDICEECNLEITNEVLNFLESCND